MFKIRRFFVVFALLVTTGAWGAGYYCPTLKVYTSCASGLYLSDCGSYRDGRTISSPAAGNACNACPAGYKCAGGAVCPVANTYKVTLNNQSATTAGTTEYYYQYKTKGKCYYYTSSALTTCIGGTSGDTITVPQRTGYKFGGYYTGKNGTGTMYVDSTGVTRNNLYSNHAGNITLYAKWTMNTVKVTYNLNGGTGTAPASRECQVGVSCSLADEYETLQLATRGGYTFAGWGTSPESTTGTFSIVTTVNRYVYAVWKPCSANTYIVADVYSTNNTCSACPANSTSAAGASACTCNAGYSVGGTATGATTTTTTACSKITITPKFTVTTTALAANTTFSFTIGAAGTFWVDWGDGSAVQKITRTAVTSSTYSHTYANAGTYTIGFDGLATAYAAPATVPESDCVNVDSVFNVVSAISFANAPVVSASGSIGAIFPTLSNGNQPLFTRLFYKTQVTNVDGNLFDGVHGAPYPYMFKSIFDQAQLAEIPSGLFSGIRGSAHDLFRYAFLKTQIKFVPTGLFKNITGAATCMFFGTFAGAESLATIPANLFSGLSGAAEGMFGSAFSTTGITEIPETLFSGVTGGASKLFRATFLKTPITTVPENLFAGITVPAENEFIQTFDSSGLTSVPGGLFKNITGIAPGMFNGVFMNTKIESIPDGLFSHITGTPGKYSFASVFYGVSTLKGYVPTDMFNKNLTIVSEAMTSIFAGTGLATACPAGMTQYKTGWESQWSSKVACTPCAAGTYKAGTGNAACAACAVGAYSVGTGNTACTACNNNGNWGKTTSGVGQTSCNATCPNADVVKGWATATWNSNNTVANLCMANSCVSGHYLDNGTCPRCDSFANGLYPHSANSGTTGGKEACFVRRNELPGQYIVAGAETATDCPAGTYMGTTDETAVHYGEGYSCKTCGADTYAAGTGNTACTACLENYHTFGDKVSAAACRISCPGGSYLATANATTCTHVGAGYYAEQSYVPQGNVGTRNQCPLNLTTIGYGVGADELGDCGRVLHVGDGKLYLRGERLTTPSLVVNVGGTNFYGNMSTDVKKMSDNVDKSLRINYNGATYSVYDDSGAVYVPGETPAVTIDPNLVAATIVPAAYNTAAGETEWSATLSDGTELSGRALCSATTAKNGETSAAGFTPDGTGTGCWCQLDNALAGAVWVYGTTTNVCADKCGYFCANNMKRAKSVTFRTNLYQAAGIRVP